MLPDDNRQTQSQNNSWLSLEIYVKADRAELLQGLEQWLELNLISEAQVKKICRENLSCHLPEIKVAASGLTVSAAIGTGILVYNFNSAPSDITPIVDLENEGKNIVIADTPPQPKVSKQGVVPFSFTKKEKKESPKTGTQENVTKKNTLLSKKENDLNQSFARNTPPKPTLVETFDDPTFIEKSDELTVGTLKIINEDITEADISLDNITNSKYNFHYSFDQGKLSLYGNFRAGPYEIVELNEEGNKNLYMFYDSVYYYIKKDQVKPKKFDRVSNKPLIRKLQIARQNIK